MKKRRFKKGGTWTLDGVRKTDCRPNNEDEIKVGNKKMKNLTEMKK